MKFVEIEVAKPVKYGSAVELMWASLTELARISMNPKFSRASVMPTALVTINRICQGTRAAASFQWSTNSLFRRLVGRLKSKIKMIGVFLDAHCH